LEELWQQSVEKNFQKVADQQNANLSKFLSSQAKYLDERVDNMRKQKDEELEQYKRDIER
jgi:gas vesicle protein